MTGALVMQSVSGIDRDLRRITNVVEPRSAAANEMEINILGTGLGVAQYLDTVDPVFRRRVREDEREFEASKARYDRLSSGPTSARLGPLRSGRARARGASSARSGQVPGGGLGLMITKAIVSGHGGRITVDSREGGGTTFAIALPLGVGRPEVRPAPRAAPRRA